MVKLYPHVLLLLGRADYGPTLPVFKKSFIYQSYGGVLRFGSVDEEGEQGGDI
ncbi:hypothetical protein [Halomonas sp. BC04]|uniref:hypothetical protein n=1 Tax=Halomonas sp. BC04 TaxID=1403540 RepID=UPI0012DF595F|nr:hypothetical protein [Halomonas sp. BC04]